MSNFQLRVAMNARKLQAVKPLNSLCHTKTNPLNLITRQGLKMQRLWLDLDTLLLDVSVKNQWETGDLPSLIDLSEEIQ